MPTIEKRLQALEQENVERKKTEELFTLALRGCASKEALEKLQTTVEESLKKSDKLFEVLINHDRLANEQLAELRKLYLIHDGKIVGLQTEMRQRFAEQDGKITKLDERVTRLDNKVTKLDERVTKLDERVTRLDERVTGLDDKVTKLDERVTGLDDKVTKLDERVTGLQTTQIEHTSMLQQILARLPEKL